MTEMRRGKARRKQAMCVSAPHLNMPTARLFCTFFLKHVIQKLDGGDTKIVHSQKVVNIRFTHQK